MLQCSHQLSIGVLQLFNGSFQHITAKVDVSGLKVRLEHFFLKVLMDKNY